MSAERSTPRSPDEWDALERDYPNTVTDARSEPERVGAGMPSPTSSTEGANQSGSEVSSTPSVLHGTAVVWKLPVAMPDERGRSFVEIPNEAELLSVGLQNDRLVVWALTDSLNEPHIHRIIVANTGMSIPDFPPDARFLGTVTTSNGIVWHVWDGDA